MSSENTKIANEATNETIVKNEGASDEAAAPAIPKETKLGICRILSTKNNTVIHVTDVTGSITYAKVSGGMKVKSKKDEGSAYAAILAAQDASERILSCGINTLNFMIRGRGGLKKKAPGAGLSAALRAIASTEGISVGRIQDVTARPSDSTRGKGGNRGRRV